MSRNPSTYVINTPFYSFASFSIVPLISFINKPGSSGYLTFFMINFISLFDTISVNIPNQKTFFFKNWDSLHAKLKQPLQGMELPEKEAQKD